ncbi:MAG: hypothetical protein IKQ61_10115, partial [Spirochaetales bacterium]|nr:hypothetical protein [Spirochaetales bacterium]
MKRLLNLLLILALVSVMTSCIYDFVNHVGADGGAYRASNDKITSLQVAVNQADDGAIINLSEYPVMTDFSATINKALTINSNTDKDLQSGLITVETSNVHLNGLTNISVTAGEGIGSGSLKIASSSLNSLTINGGGMNSIHLMNGTKIFNKTIIDKKYSNENDAPVRLVVDNTVTINELRVQSSALLDSGTSKVTSDNLPNVIFAVDKLTDNRSVSLAVSANLSFKVPDELARIGLQDSVNITLKMDIFVLKNDKTSKIQREFVNKAFKKLVGTVSDDAKSEFDKAVSSIIDRTITDADDNTDKNIDDLVKPIRVTLHYNNGTGDTTADTYAVGKELDVSSCGIVCPGYKLLGWSRTQDAKTADKGLEAGKYVTIDKDETFYFVWAEDKNAPIITVVDCDVWTFTDKIESISTAWTGGPDDPQFSVLFINDTIAEIYRSMGFFNGEIIPNGQTFYQIRQEPVYANITFVPGFGDGTWATQYDGVCVTITGDTYTVYVDRKRISNKQLKAFSRKYAVGTDEPYAKQMTDDDDIDLSSYYPVIIALSDVTTDVNCIGQMWNGAIHRMQPYKGAYPTMSPMPECVTFDVKFTGTVSVDALDKEAFPYNSYSIEWTVKNVQYYKGMYVPYNFMADCSGVTDQPAAEGATLTAELSASVIDGLNKWEADETPAAYRRYKITKKCNIGIFSEIWLGFNGLIDEFDIDHPIPDNPIDIVDSWVFTDKFANISAAWNGNKYIPSFTVIFMTDEQMSSLLNTSADFYEPHSVATDEMPIYQIRDEFISDICFDVFFYENNIQNATNYSGVWIYPNGESYKLILIPNEVSKKCWLRLTSSDERLSEQPDLTGYTPYIIALSDNTTDEHYLCRIWDGNCHKLQYEAYQYDEEGGEALSDFSCSFISIDETEQSVIEEKLNSYANSALGWCHGVSVTESAWETFQSAVNDVGIESLWYINLSQTEMQSVTLTTDCINGLILSASTKSVVSDDTVSLDRLVILNDTDTVTLENISAIEIFVPADKISDYGALS